MRGLSLLLVTCLLAACNSGTSTSAVTAPTAAAQDTPASPPATSPAPPMATSYDVDTLGVPRFVVANYLDPTSLQRVSRFRSGYGHDYSDNVESCRSMKHYFQPLSGLNWSTLPIVSPVNGRIDSLMSEWAGVQIRIEPTGYPAFRVVIFHVTPLPGIGEGVPVAAGQPLGTHVGTQTMSDVAISVDSPAGYRLVSYFDAMSDAAFTAFQNRGAGSRGDLIVSRAARDGQPLACSGETFANGGTLENWVNLH